MDNREDKDSDQEKQPQRQPQQGRTPGAFVGMRNLTNTCFINSLLQSMYTLNLLRDLVVGEEPSEAEHKSTQEHPDSTSPPPQQPGSPPNSGALLDTPALRIWRAEGYNEQLKLTCHFLNTLREVWTGTKTPIVPIEMLKAMAAKYSQYNDYGQQDSHEFLRQLFDAMRMEELDVIYASQPGLKERGTRRIKKLQPHHYQNLTPTTFVDRLCEGMVVNVIICASCKQIYHVYEPFLDISLALQDENKTPKRRGFRQSIRESLLGPKPEGVKKDVLTVEDVVLSDTEDGADEEDKEGEQAQAPPPKSKRFSFRNSFSLGSGTPRSSLRLGPFPPPSPSSSPHQGASQLAAPPSGMLGRRVSKKINRRVSSAVEENDDTTRKTKRSLEDKIYTQKLFGDLTTPSTPQSTHSASMSELASDQTMTSLSTSPKEYKDGQAVNAPNAQNSVLAALRQPPPSNDGSADSEPMSAVSSASAFKTGIEEAFERYAGIETLQHENEFHCHGCWKMQNEVQVEMIKRYRESKRKDRNGKEKLSLGLGGMTPLNEGEKLKSGDGATENGTDTGYTSSASQTDDEESDADDDDDITEKDWKDFYGDTVAHIPRKKQVVGTKALRRSLIAIAPPVLVLHLKRFGSVGGFALSKIFDNVTFPTELDIGPYIAPARPAKDKKEEKDRSDADGLDLPDDADPTTTEDYKRLAELAYPINSTRYKLRSTVNHCGRTMISGHYTAFASRELKMEEGDIGLQWYWASDETVKQKTEDQFLHESFKNDDQNVYVLVYERI